MPIGRSWTWLVSIAGSLLAFGTASMASGSSPADPPAGHLESRRLRSAAVYIGTVSAIHRLGDLDGLTGEKQGRMEATVRVAKTLRTIGRAAVAEQATIKFDDRTPEPEGEGFYALAVGEAVLVFADGFEPAYPRELWHGTPTALAAEVKVLRDFVATMDADTLRLHGLTAATQAAQVRLYDEALAAVPRTGSK